MRIQQIDTESGEGKLLYAALVIITTSDDILVNGRRVKGTGLTPDEALTEVETLAKVMYGEIGIV